MTTRTAEFAAGTGTSVVVDSSRKLHLSATCAKAAKKTVATYANEKTARSAIPGVRACKHCR